MVKLRFDGFYMNIREGSVRLFIFIEDNTVIMGVLETFSITVPVRERIQVYEKRFNSGYFNDLNMSRRTKFIGGDSYTLGKYSTDPDGGIKITISDDEIDIHKIYFGWVKQDSLDLSRHKESPYQTTDLYEFAIYSDEFLQSKNKNT